jgi:transposase
MEKKNRLYSKIRRLFRLAGHPKWVHRMGPKKFETFILCFGLVVKQVYRLSYRRAVKFLDEFYDLQVHWTTLQKAAKRLPKSLWQSLLAATIEVGDVYLAAADGTGFSRSNASNHYLKRIDRDDRIKRPVQAIALVDVKQRKFLAANFYAKPRGEAKRIPTLHKKCEVDIEVLLMDKGFDAEWLHQWLKTNGTFSIAPTRKGCRRGSHRKLMRDCFDWCLYWQRNIVEALFSAIKRLFGGTLNTKHIRTQTAELFCRLIAYNVGHSLLTFST